MPGRIASTMAALLIVASTAAGCGDISAIGEESNDHRSFPFAGESLTIENHNGDLRLVPGPPGEIGVERTLTGKATTGDNATWELDGQTLSLSVTCSGLVPDCGGHHIVEIPDGVTVTVRSQFGPVRAVGITSDLTATVDDSWLTVEDPAGELRLRASFHVEVTGARSASVVASSLEGDVTMTLLEPPTEVEVAAARSVTLTLPAGEETYEVRTRSDGGTVDSIASDADSRRSIEVAATGSIRIRQQRVED